MKQALRRLSVALLVVVAGCSYSLPPNLQMEVDDIKKQNEALYSVVRRIKAGANTASVSRDALRNAGTRYGELTNAYADWNEQLRRVIANEVDNYDSDETYQNSVHKLENASREFEKAADAALGGGTPTHVPAWPVEVKTLINQSHDERKMRDAASIIQGDLVLLTWDEL